MKIINIIVSVAAIINNTEKLLVIIFSASSLFFSPIFIAASGAPPIPTNAANADTKSTIGNATPIPAIATSPFSIRPINILSTILYKTFTNWAIIAGVANFNNNFPILSFPKSVVEFDINLPPILFMYFTLIINSI